MKESISEELTETKAEIEEYINARVDLVRLHTAENLSRFFSGLIVKLVVFFLIFFAFLFVSLAAAYWIDQIVGQQGTGFLFVAGFYFFCALLFWLLRRKLVEKPIIKSFIQLFFPVYLNYDETKK